jgi:putative intracellular protease/amidase
MPTLYLYILDTFSDWETGHALAELHSGRFLKDQELKYDVVLCGRTPDTITTMGGLRMTPDMMIEDIRPGDTDILILPGADMWLDPGQLPVLAKVAHLLKGGTIVAAICGATLGLACAGLLDNRPHTSNDPGALRMFCPGYKGEQFYRTEPAVTDNNLITASGLAPVEFACHIFRKLGVMHPATLDAWRGFFTTRRPEYFYALMASLPDQRKGQ